MLTTGFFTVASTGKVDVVSMVVVSAAFGDQTVELFPHGADYSLSAKTVTRISIFYVFFFGLDFLIFAGGPSSVDRLLAATVHLVLFLAVMKTFSARTYRDYGFLAATSFLLMHFRQRRPNRRHNVFGLLHALRAVRHLDLYQL